MMEPYVRLLRIRNWLGYFLLSVLGFIVAEGFSYPILDICVLYLLVILFLGFSFTINDCFDVEEDKLDSSKRNPVATGELPFKKGFFFSISLAIAGISLSLFFGLKLFLFYLTLTIISLFYSAPPIRFKSRFLLDLISHGLFFGAFLFILPVISFNIELTQIHYLIAFSIFYFSVILELRNHLEDYESDKGANLKTTVCVLGKDKSKKIIDTLALIFPGILLLVLYQQYLYAFLILSLAFYITFLTQRRYRVIDIYANISYGLLILGVVS